MKRMVLAGWVIAAAAGIAMGTDTPSKPETPEKLKDAATDALQSYLFAQSTNDMGSMKKLVYVSDESKKGYADPLISFMLWSRYLERKAIEKFGKEEGMRVQGHVRSFEEQYKIDSRRVRDANVQYNADKSAATVFLRVEANRPANLQIGDRYNFLDSYEMIKTGEGWRVDFLKTYKFNEAEKLEEYQADIAALPRMTKVLKELSEQLKAGTMKTADDLKNTYEEKWAHVYDEPFKAEVKPGVEGGAAPEPKK